MGREKGVVKWFSTEKGYGFIRRDSGEEIFVHHTDIQVDGYASLKNGEAVEFEVFQSDRGPKAHKLVPVESPGDSTPRETKTDGAGARDERTGQRRSGRRGNRSRGRGGAESIGTGARPREAPRDSGERRTENRRPLAQLLRDRLGSRFPGFGS